jgi:phage-related protein
MVLMADNENVSMKWTADVSDLKAALNEANRAIRLANSEFKAGSDGTKEYATSLTGASQKISQLSSVLEGQQRKMAVYQTELERVTAEYGENSAQADNVRIKMNNLQGEINSTETSMRKYQSIVDEAGDESKQLGEDAEKGAKGVKEMGDEGDKTSGKLDKLKTAGKAAVAGIAAIATAALAAGAALGKAALSAGEYADEILTNSAITGLSTEALQQYSYAAELMDVSSETISAALKRNTRAMSEAQQGTEDYANAYATLGVSVTNADGTLRSSTEVFDETIAALGNVANETERDALAMQLFGRSATELNPMIMQGADGLAALRQEAIDAGAVMSGEALDALGSFDDQVQRMKQSVSIMTREFGAGFVPVMSEGMAIFKTAIDGLDGDLTRLPQVVGPAVSGLVGMVATQLPQLATTIVSTLAGIAQSIVPMLPQLVTMGMQVITNIITGLAQAAPTLIPTIVQAILAAVMALIEQLPQFLDAGLQLVMGLIEGIITAIPMIIEALPQIIDAIVGFLGTAIPAIIDAGIQLLTALVDNMPTIIDAIVTAIPLIIDAIVNFFTGPALPAIIQAGVQLFIALVQNLPTIIAAIVKAIPEIILAIVNALGNAIGQIAQAGYDVFTSLIDNLPQIIQTIINSMPQIINNIISTIGSWGSQVVDAGRNLIGGLAQGITNGISGVITAIKNAVGNAINTAKSMLGIASPSKVFANFGELSAEGYEQGVLGTMDKAKRKMQQAFDFSNLSSILPGNSPGVASSTVTNVYTLNLDGHAIAGDSIINDAIETIFKRTQRQMRMGVV